MSLNMESTDDKTTATEAVTQGKTYTQQEVDDMAAGLRASVQRKYEKQLAELGDIEELKQLKANAEATKAEEAKKRGDFDRIISELASKKDAEIQSRDNIIKEYRINTPLIQEAAKFNAVNPEQVKQLLSSNVRMNDTGEVEVVDTKGVVRYDDKGKPLAVADLVKEFLGQNPHFVVATPATAMTNSSHQKAASTLDTSKLNMSNPEHRRLYKEHMQANKR
jgi:hypothetical protein